MSIQNVYSLVNRVFDVGNSEVLSQNEDVFVILGVPLMRLMAEILSSTH